MGLRLTIYSGGQTGADMAALNFALRHGLGHGGWCPRGRRYEEGVIPSRFILRETPSRGYLQRTQWNVRDSHGTVIFSIGKPLKGGSRETARFARKLGKPCLHLAASSKGVQHDVLLRRFILKNRIRILNVAGPRRSQEPTVGRFAARVLRLALCHKGRVPRKRAALQR